LVKKKGDNRWTDLFFQKQKNGNFAGGGRADLGKRGQAPRGGCKRELRREDLLFSFVGKEFTICTMWETQRKAPRVSKGGMGLIKQGAKRKAIEALRSSLIC